MTDDAYRRAKELMREGEALPHGDLKVSVLQQAVKYADVTRDIDLMFEARMSLSEAGTFSGNDAVALTAFAWCLAQFKDSPKRFESQESTILWRFKNVLSSPEQLPQISRERFIDLTDQMGVLYRQCGYNMRPIHFLRWRFAYRNGDFAAAEELHRQVLAEPRDALSDCTACEADNTVAYYDAIDEPLKAVEAAKHILSGRLRCLEVPARTHANLLRSLALLGRVEEADQYQSRNYRRIKNNTTFLKHVALHMAYMAHRRQPSGALRILERHLAVALTTCELRSRYYFYVAAKRLLEVAADGPVVSLKLPQQFPAYQDTQKYDAAQLADWFDLEGRELARRFDERNGNDYFSTRLVEHLRF